VDYLEAVLKFMQSKHKLIGKCIYCGSAEDLTDEHVIPYSLDGDIVLDDASCKTCAQITSGFETHVTRDGMQPVRAMLGLKTRKKKKRPKEFPVAVARDDQRVTELVPVEDYVGVLPYVERGMPGYLAHWKHPLGRLANFVAMAAKSVFRHEGEHLELAAKLGTEYLAIDFPLEPKEFGRMIAKIAYCTAVSKIGLNQWEEVFVIPAILGQRDDIWHWVGSEGKISEDRITRPKQGSYHITKFWVHQRHVLVSVQLFANADTPEYLVVVGRVTESLASLFSSLGVRDAE
jgi:hypothetical protein